ncbi:MAG: STAS domain-containing protein [Ruminococcaceae bacterium]|nr:STAS domain-containing protein [Oscillospiraceae bacterium]
MNTRRMNGDTLEVLNGKNVIISLTEKLVNKEMHISVSGEIKNEVAHEFEDELMASFSVCNVVKLDLSKVTYIASIAMRALLSVQQIIDENKDAVLLITSMSPEVKEMFDSAGFLDILNIEE